MNKVHDRCQKDECAKFYYGSKKLYGELKFFKVVLYILAAIPVTLALLPKTILDISDKMSFVFTMISFAVTLGTELLSGVQNNLKEHAILQHQMYESEITGSTFSKIEYDREATNDVHEIAIRKGYPLMKRAKKYPTVNVPSEISDDHSYLYLTRKNAATTKYLLSRVFYTYLTLLFAIALLFIMLMLFYRSGATEYFALIIGFYPLVIPIIRAVIASYKCQRQCAKICADIDNFFADGDASIERLARFYYYVQNIEFEMLTTRPTIGKFFHIFFRKGVRILDDGVTVRFIEATKELRGKSKNIITQAKGKDLITKKDIDIAEIERKEALKKERERKKLLKQKEQEKKASTTVKKTTTKKK